MTEKTDRRPSNLSKRVQITNKQGLHARAATIIAKKAITATSDIWIIRDNEMANASSILDILTLACTKGTWITLKSEDPTDYHILLDIEETVKSGFGE